MKREFFSVRTVAEARTGFAPARRTATEQCSLAEGVDRVTAAAIFSPQNLPGFARSAVDGYAVRAADTFGASSSLPVSLKVHAEIEMGAAPTCGVEPGEAVAIPTGGALPTGADAIVMIEQTAPTVAGTVDVLGAVAPGEAVIRADEDIAVGAELVPSGERLRPTQLGVLAAAGVTSFAAFARPRVAILSTGDEIVPPATEHLELGQVRDATAGALAGMVGHAGGTPEVRGIVPDDATLLRQALTGAMESADVIVASAGSSVGVRDVTAEVVASLGEPGIWCHGLAVKPGKPTLLAECDGIPIVGLPGNPVSALVVFDLIGAPLIRTVGGQERPVARATTPAVLARDVPSAPGRLDIVQVRVSDGSAEPLFAKSSALSVLARADGQIQVPEEASGLYAGADVTVELHG